MSQRVRRLSVFAATKPMRLHPSARDLRWHMSILEDFSLSGRRAVATRCAAVFLASPAASWTTGQVLLVHGGR